MLDATDKPPAGLTPVSGAASRNRTPGFFTYEGLRLRTSVRLRWLAVSGQLIAVLLVHFGLGFPLPQGACLTISALSAWLNIALSLSWSFTARLHERFSSLMLAYDILQLAILIYLTGGLANPFSFLFVVPVTVSAATLPLSAADRPV